MKSSQQFSFDRLAFHLASTQILNTENISLTKSLVVEMIQPWKSNCSWLVSTQNQKSDSKTDSLYGLENVSIEKY